MPLPVRRTCVHWLRSAIFMLPLVASPVFAAPANAIDSIKQRYDEVQKKSSDKGSYYQHEIHINSNGRDAPAVGNWSNRVTFYMDEPDGPMTSVWEAIPARVRVRTVEADSEYIGDYFFNERGRLIFVFEKDQQGERRYYIHNGKLLRVIKGKQINDTPEQAQSKALQKQANGLLDLLRVIRRAMP